MSSDLGRILSTRPLALSGALAAALALGACAQGQNYNTGVTSPSGIGLGTAGGAGAGALLGRAIAGKHDNTLAMLGGALLGGIAGNVLVDRPNEIRSAQQAQANADLETQRKLDYERQSALQKEQVRKEIEEQNLYEQWKRERTGAATPAAVTGTADVMTAQRLLTALGYYRGPIDGVYGARTRSGIMQFEASQGLPQTGSLTPSIIQRMRSSLAASS
ncbi:peptidoglycan-binding domain-containing protein [Benzoatithermus flavus]|uniref:17 kDa surface antigen n=1 Tax=Benzoatithermus flavus TaxID=3108223 RepID=A0ABU8XRK4_9PROT